ncbi:DUF1569 domain-containing protein [Cognatitamlana onchidii]|uniref:DUF1569 domain-containing protein n=1 Tax=Cognatitamlana onchidii TaxID=2562860 RepID=UPI0010A64C0C|nr:DUF1569 domain-containing protein [Algibacter onchidii]
MSKKHISTLYQLLDKIETAIPHLDRIKPSISKVEVGWHLDHSLKVINRVTTILLKTNPKKHKRDFNLARSVLFPLHFIPRGKAKAPKVVMPPEIITLESLNQQLTEVKKQIDRTKPLPETSHFIHHVFGVLSKQQTLKFLAIHTKHHLKIVTDILNK